MFILCLISSVAGLLDKTHSSTAIKIFLPRLNALDPKSTRDIAAESYGKAAFSLASYSIAVQSSVARESSQLLPPVGFGPKQVGKYVLEREYSSHSPPISLFHYLYFINMIK